MYTWSIEVRACSSLESLVVTWRASQFCPHWVCTNARVRHNKMSTESRTAADIFKMRLRVDTAFACKNRLSGPVSKDQAEPGR